MPKKLTIETPFPSTAAVLQCLADVGFDVPDYLVESASMAQRKVTRHAAPSQKQVKKRRKVAKSRFSRTKTVTKRAASRERLRRTGRGSTSRIEPPFKSKILSRISKYNYSPQTSQKASDPPAAPAVMAQTPNSQPSVSPEVRAYVEALLKEKSKRRQARGGARSRVIV